MTKFTEKNELKSTSVIWLIGGSLMVVVTLIVLTWLYIRAESVSPKSHINYTQELRNLREFNARVDSEVLATRMELSRNYDALAGYIIKTENASVLTLLPPEYLLSSDNVKLSFRAKLLNKTLKQKADKVELFKRYNSILLNSLSYFQKTADDFLHANADPNILVLLENYVRHVMFYVRSPDQQNSKPLQQIMQKVKLMQLDSSHQLVVDNLLLHGNVIFEYQPKVDDQMREILYLPISRLQNELANTYLDGYKNAQSRAQNYRNFLYFIAVILTAYLAFVFMRLFFTRRSLALAHKEVTQRYQAQKLAEQSLRLHGTAFDSAHEGITLTDANRNILEVNPAFTRITGFEREEVIGRNPRVLRSGRHDDKFYQSMWKAINETGNWRGEIWNRNKYGEVYPEMLSITTVLNEQGEVTNYVAVFTDISRIKEQEVQLRKMAYYDALTDLPNRVLFTDRIYQAMLQTKRNKNIMAVCFLDLDGFKPINDTYGHDAGDKLLIELANRFKAEQRAGDTVARLGGDEFVFLYVGLESTEEYALVVQRLMNCISKSIKLKNEIISISASIGVTLYPIDNSDADTLLRHADQAMYLAKQKGKNCFHLFDPELDSMARSQHKRIVEIEQALINNEMHLYYQPKVNLRKGEVIGFEGLIRWLHPEQGIIPPLDFLPLIEDDQLIVTLGKWVIKTALDQLEIWLDLGFKTSVSVNVASLQLQDPNFFRDLKLVLSEHPRINPNQLELEVLETAALEDIVNVSRIIEDCNELGVLTSLDDFGTGYSSLTYLKRLPTSALKIDQSFVRDMMHDPENLAIVQGILGLTRAFRKHIIAEGMETPEHGRMLLQLGCDCAQGYGIAKPMQADEVVNWVNLWEPDLEYTSISQYYWIDADYPMFSAEVEHKRWITLLTHSIQNNQPVVHKNIGDFHHCCLGQWYYKEGIQRYGENPEFKNIELIHKDVHLVAEKIDQLYRDGKLKRAKELIPELLVNQDHILLGLKKLSLSVAKKL